ncbi:ABC transporter ATP-binding protein [Microbacteriaceae bacterium 4G12]
MDLVEHTAVKQLSFTYPNEERQALSSLSLSISQGEFVVLAGQSGCGKTTLLKHLKKELLPVGMRRGEVFYNGMSMEDVADLVTAQEIGMVFQNPENQFVMDTVIQELAFSLENVGYSTAIIQKRIAELVSFIGFQDLLHQSVHKLSGGQKQLVNLAAVLVLQPKLLLLDEPTAQLDPIAAKEFLTLLKRIHEELGITIVMSEHRLDEVLPLADRVVFMESGNIIHDGAPKDVVQSLWSTSMFRPYIPQIPRLFLEYNHTELPFTVRDGQQEWEKFKQSLSSIEVPIPSSKGEKLLEAKAISFQYEKDSPIVLQHLSLSVQEGEWIGLVGKNGTGKSTLLTVLAGLQKCRRGKVLWKGKPIHKVSSNELYKEIGYVSQYPYYHFTHDTVWEELLTRALELRCSSPVETVENILEQFSISSIRNRHPHDCSGGEQQLIAISSVLLSNPCLLLLDEPTKGIDPEKKEELGHLLQGLQKKGTTILMSTHDIEFAAKFVNRCMMLFDGQVIMEEAPQQFFSENFFYTTAINRLIRKQLPYALTWEDVIKACPNGMLALS